ncbi:hypothetical protein BLA29_011161 [Euroglyphus maynei]|uniref:Uncharacterized protein n=1 Tax=Euroglyphus maynei TaxID=6958 RepID=A0A1Y3BA94_EURMA|nr:hypothetical protein BLA29_011161 [Euroglyphus maynei]
MIVVIAVWMVRHVHRNRNVFGVCWELHQVQHQFKLPIFYDCFVYLK